MDASISVPGSQCLDVVQTNGQNPGSSCAPPVNLNQDPSPAVLLLVGGNDGVSYQYGVVQTDVARVVIALSDDSTLTLRPYRLRGQRWVAFAVPTSLAIASATAYSNRSELGYAIPHGDEFVTWLRPGEHGLPRATYVIGSGVANGVSWSVILHAGPWGYCFSTGTCSPPLPRTATNGSFIGSTSGGGWTIVGEASPSVAYVVGTLSDGSTIRVRAVDVGGPKLCASPGRPGGLGGAGPPPGAGRGYAPRADPGRPRARGGGGVLAPKAAPGDRAAGVAGGCCPPPAGSGSGGGTMATADPFCVVMVE